MACVEEGLATRSSVLAWRIPWTEEPGGLQSTGSQRVGHDGSDLHARTHGLCCWRICVVCLALELVGPWLVLGFSVGMEAFGESEIQYLDAISKTTE